MKFSRQEYWSGFPFPSPGHLPDPGIELGFLHCRQILYHLSYQGTKALYGMLMLVSQLCLTLYDPVDYSLPGPSVHTVLQGRILEWVSIPFSRGFHGAAGAVKVLSYFKGKCHKMLNYRLPPVVTKTVLCL